MVSDYNSTLEVVCIPGYILPNGRRNQLLRCDSNTLWRNADNPLRNNNILRRVSFLFRRHSTTTFVDQILPNLEPPPPRVDKNGHFAYYIPFVTWPLVDNLLSPSPPPLFLVHVVIECPLGGILWQSMSWVKLKVKWIDRHFSAE